jgi:hypothetical protein
MVDGEALHEVKKITADEAFKGWGWFTYQPLPFFSNRSLLRLSIPDFLMLRQDDT